MTGLEILILSASAFCTSALTAVVGAGGGTALIAIMLQVLSPAAAIPVHGAVQLASNTTRVYLLWRHMHWPIILRFGRVTCRCGRSCPSVSSLARSTWWSV